MRDTRPLVSVIIPCFRHAHYLPEAVESVLQQQDALVEAIVINDGSDDNTDEVARSYGSQIVYIAQENQGLSNARNTGIQAARGKYAIFLDADDKLVENAVTTFLRFASPEGRDLCIGGFVEFNATTGEHIRENIPSPLEIRRAIIHSNFGPPPIYLVPILILRQIGGFEPSLRSCEDWDCWIRLLNAGAHPVIVPHIVAYYRNVPGSMSKQLGTMYETRCKVLVRYFEAANQDPSLLDLVGHDLSIALRCELRRNLIQKHFPRELNSELYDTIRLLARLGYRAPCTPKKRLADLILGPYSENLYAALFGRWSWIDQIMQKQKW